MLIVNKVLQSVAAVFVTAYLITSTGHAENLDRCKHLFYSKAAPIVVNERLSVHNYDLCYTGFAVKYSGISKTGLWSASMLTPESLELASKISRNNTFHEEERIPLQYRSLLSDFRGSSFDRGHLSPSADRKSIQDQYESFALSNMIPQSPYNNQETWRLVEESVRTYVKRNKQPVYVITGPLYLGNKLRKIGNNVLVPSHVYKVVLFPKLNVAGAYVAVNDESGRLDYVSINQLQQFSGILFFPSAAKSEIFNYRFTLPINSREASRMNGFRAANVNYSSIFNELPRYGGENIQPSNNSIKSKVQENRNEVVDIATEAAKSNVGIVADWVKKVLSK